MSRTAAKVLSLYAELPRDPGAAFATALADLVRASVADALADAVAGLREEPAPVLVDRRELARQLACSDRTIARLESEGLPVVRVGDAPRYRVQAVVAWLEAKRCTS